MEAINQSISQSVHYAPWVARESEVGVDGAEPRFSEHRPSQKQMLAADYLSEFHLLSPQATSLLHSQTFTTIKMIELCN